MGPRSRESSILSPVLMSCFKCESESSLLQVAEMRDVLILTGNVEGGIPPFQPPWHFGLNATDVAGGPDIEGPLDIAGHLGMGLAMMPLVANLQQLAIAKFYTRELSE